MTLHEQFLDQIERFLTRTGMSPTSFGNEAVRDPVFVFQIRKGRSPSLDVVERVNAFMRENRGTKRKGRAA